MSTVVRHVRRAWAAWVELLDRREPATALALVRITLACVLFADYLQLGFAGLVEPLYTRGPGGFAIGEAWLAGPAAWALGTVCLAAIAVGAATRVACIGFVIASAALSHITPDAESGLDMLARVVFVILAMSRCNARWSLDAWLARRLGREVPRDIPAWPRYLLMLQLVWVYFSGGMNKSAGAWGPQGGFAALANALSDPHAARFAPAWVGTIYPLTRVATALTMVFELAAPLYLVAYARRWRIRWAWLALGVMFELGIAFGLRLGSFPYGMLALYPVLLRPEDLTAAYARLKARTPANRASSPSWSAMRSSWLYFAIRSRARRRAGLDLARVGRDREVGDERVLGLARAVRDDRGVAGVLRGADRVERLGERADLVDLDQDRVGDAAVDAALEARGLGHEQVVADELDLAAELLGHAPSSRPSRPRRGRPRSRRAGTCRPTSA